MNMNMSQLMKQTQTMQKKMQEMQAEMAQKNFEGKAGGGLVTVIASGIGHIKKVIIDPSIFKEEEKEILEDLVVAACNDVRQKVDETSKQNMSGAFGNLAGMIPGSSF